MEDRRAASAADPMETNILKQKLAGRKWIALPAIIIIAAVLILMWYLSRETAEAIVVEQQKFEEKIIAAGQLQLARETTLVSEVSSEIRSISAREGAVIPAGTLLIAMDDSDSAFQLEQKKSSYQNADAQYRHLVDFEYPAAQEELISRKAKLAETKKSFEAASKLFAEGAIAQMDYLNYQSEYEASRSAWNTSNLNVLALGEGGALRNSAYAQLQSARTLYEAALNDQKDYMITVPWDAILLKAYVSEYDLVRPGDRLAEIGEAGSYHVAVELDEKYFPYLMQGMKAIVSLDGQKEGTEGTVSVITPKISSETGTFGVTIALPEGFPYQASDLTVTVEIIIREQEQAIVIPEQYLLKDESSVFLYRNGVAEKTSVKYQSGPASELLITDGLKEGDILLRPDDSLQDGKKVRVNKGVGAS